MSLTNPMGDFEVTDPRAMRALAHPVRLAILNRLQRHGPATATQLAPHVKASPSVASWHLRHLAEFGLVSDWNGGPDRRQRWWQAVAKGFRFEMPDDDEGQAAASMLRGQLMAAGEDLVQTWLGEVAPRLEGQWQKVGGSANTRVVVTAEEAGDIHARIEEILAPYVVRRDHEADPAGSRGVRILRYFLPEADDADVAGGPAGAREPDEASADE